MMARLLMRAAAALVLLTGSAFAASAQNYDGSGVVKFGVFGQGNWLDVDQSLPAIASASPSGFGGGVSAGYDYRWGALLIGAEIDGSLGDARDKAGITDYGFDYLFTARAKLGVYPTPYWLLYGTAGVGYLGVEMQEPGIGNKAVETLTGFVAGAGTEVDWNHIILFGEWLYGSYDDAKFNIAGVQHNASFDSHMFRLGVKFRVGHDYKHDYDHPQDYRRRGGPLK
jgi:opacity protein-like surface antigen